MHALVDCAGLGSGGGDGDRREAREPVGAGGEDGGEAGAPAEASVAVGRAEGADGLQRGDAVCGVARGDQGAQAVARRGRVGAVAPRLAEDGAAAEAAGAGAPALGGGRLLDGGDALAQLAADRVGVAGARAGS
ncbi:MAG: hypothetical protein IPL61_04750 [Myxococcales bacterium]|nr:hypothetical protein [Myxococcales bacterium]